MSERSARVDGRLWAMDSDLRTEVGCVACYPSDTTPWQLRERERERDGGTGGHGHGSFFLLLSALRGLDEQGRGKIRLHYLTAHSGEVLYCTVATTVDGSAALLCFVDERFSRRRSSALPSLSGCVPR